MLGREVYWNRAIPASSSQLEHFQADFSLSKRMRFRESEDVEFQATFYNTFDHLHFAFGSPSFDAAISLSIGTHVEHF